MHAKTLRRRRHVAAALLMDAHDVLPMHAFEPKRHVRHWWQLGRPIEQRVDQIGGMICSDLKGPLAQEIDLVIATRLTSSTTS